LTGACLDLGPAVPYSPLIEALRGVDPAPTLLLDALTTAVDVPRSRLFALLRAEIAALAQRRLTVLVIEDLQWSDQITRDALLYLTATARRGRWALVVTARDDEVATRPAVSQCITLLHREALVRASLEALSPGQVAALIGGISGTVPSRQRADRIHRRTGGVPLLVEEVVAAEAAGMTTVPAHLRDMFLSRVRGLDRHAARAVEVVAVVGDRCK
jgi:predicted ATPase